jgi:hypothetical protein
MIVRIFQEVAASLPLLAMTNGGNDKSRAMTNRGAPALHRS